MKSLIPLLLISGLILFSCATEEATPEPEPTPVVVEEPAPEPIPEPVEEPADPVEESFEVSQELYEQTFEEIEALILELNSVISRRQYSRWLEYLSNPYKKTYNSREVLDQINEYPQLKDNGIRITDIKGYFDWVVVPSRSQAELDEIVFVGEDQVVAYSSFNGKRAKLYELERIEGEWKITVW